MKKTFFRNNPVQRAGTLRQAWQQRGGLSRMLRDAWKGRYKLSFRTRAAFVFALLYVLSPIDLLPDFIPFLGWGDDLGVLFLLLGRLLTELKRYQKTTWTAIPLIRVR